MKRFNPFRCNTEPARRLSIAIAVLIVLGWIVWVGFDSKGFDQVKPMGWLVFFGAPLIAYIIALLLFIILANASRGVRYLFSASIMWIFIVGTWGYIWDWGNIFLLSQYIALFILPPIGLSLGLFLWRWSKKG